MIWRQSDKAMDGEITKLIKQGEIKGKAGEISIIHTMGKIPAGKAVVIGLGKSEDLTADKIRIAIADACRALRKKGVKHIETVLIGAGVNNINPGDCCPDNHGRGNSRFVYFQPAYNEKTGIRGNHRTGN